MSKAEGSDGALPTRLWSRGGLTWRELGTQLWKRSYAHRLLDNAGLLSFYLLLAFFPLLILLSSITGFLLDSQSETYWRLLNYVALFMPHSAFLLFDTFLAQIKLGASGGKLSFGLIVTLRTASSGFSALIEALNVAFEVPVRRSWWHRRVVAIVLTLGIGVLLTVSLLFLFASSTAGAYITARLPLLGGFGRLSNVFQRLVDGLLLFACLTAIYGLGPNLKRKRWEGVLPGAFFALACWCVASWALRFYLSSFGTLTQSYGSLSGVIALLFWLYASSIAILLGGELNAIIWMSSSAKTGRPLEALSDDEYVAHGGPTE